MPRPTAALLLLLLAGLAVSAGCKDEPKAAYDRLVFHARMGNEEAFLDGFTEESRRLVRSLIALRRTYGDLVNRDSDPYLSLVLEDVQSVDTEDVKRAAADGSGTVETRLATLTVTDGKVVRKIQMIETEEGWKIDALDLQQFYAEDRKAFMDR